MDLRLLAGWDRRRRVVRLAACILAGAASFAFAAQAKANDGNFQSVLLEAGCPTAKVEKVSDRNGMSIFRANCFSTSHKIVIVTCVKGLCRSGPATYDNGEERG